jgi:hypothetical protein
LQLLQIAFAPTLSKLDPRSNSCNISRDEFFFQNFERMSQSSPAIIDCDAEDDTDPSPNGAAASASPAAGQKRVREEIIIDDDDDDDDDDNANNNAQGKTLKPPHAVNAPPPKPALRMTPADRPPPAATEALDANGLVEFVPQRRASMFTSSKPSPIYQARKARILSREIVLRALPRQAQIEDGGSRFMAVVVSRGEDVRKRGELTLADVKDAVEELRSDNSVGRAAHSGIYACRLQPSGSNTVAEFTEDDGENFSSSKVLSVLRQHKLVNVAVVVVRWFGGQLLGPRRFVHIANVSERVLRMRGLTGESPPAMPPNTDREFL